MHFTFDSNEKLKGRSGRKLKPYLETVAPVKFRKLGSADLAFTGKGREADWELTFGIEIKAGQGDVFASLRDGRFLSQLIRMIEQYDMPYLMMIGDPISVDFEDGRGRLLEWRQRKGGAGRYVTSSFSYHYLNSIFSRFEGAGGRIRYVQDVEHAAAFICSLFRFWTKGKHRDAVFVRKRHKILDWKKLEEHPLAKVYERMGIGIKRALVLEERYPTLVDLCEATKEELRNIPTFGGGSVEKVLEACHGTAEGN
jgi:ERCC4-type nuclease